MTEIVSYLHMRTPPVVHRDFTPDNLVLEAGDFEQSGKLKLIDFEVAHEHAQRTTATVVGKHSYIPPEQLRGKPVPASDLYAMGCTLYYLYTGHDPEPLSRSRLDAHLINSPEAQKLSDLIADLTTLDPAKRLSLNELRERMGMVRFETQEEALAQAPRDISHVIKIKETETIKEKA
jgi:Serine/threonine protein kinase